MYKSQGKCPSQPINSVQSHSVVNTLDYLALGDISKPYTILVYCEYMAIVTIVEW